MNAVFLDYDTVSMGDLDTSALRRIMPALKLLEDVSESRIAAHLADAEIVLINRLALSRERLLGAPRLKLIALAATGTDNVDLSAAQHLGIDNDFFHRRRQSALKPAGRMVDEVTVAEDGRLQRESGFVG